MREYFVNRLWFTLAALPVQGLPILMLCALAYGGLATGVDYKVIIGLVVMAAVGGLLWWLSFPLRKPLVRISEERIEVLSLFGQLRTVENPRDYALVLASDWIGFRRRGQNDIMVEKGRFFSKETWEALIHDVQQLPFAATL